MALEQKVNQPLIEGYSDIPIYKVLINGTIVYVNESNIRGNVEWEKKSM